MLLNRHLWFFVGRTLARRKSTTSWNTAAEPFAGTGRTRTTQLAPRGGCSASHPIGYIYLRLMHDLGLVGPIQRQNLSPVASQHLLPATVEGMAAKDHFSSMQRGHQDVWVRARRCFLDAALTQASHIPQWSREVQTHWLACLGRLRFQVMLDRLLDGIKTHELTAKTIISTWRHCGRSIMAQAQNQQDLELWQAYAMGFWRAGLILIAQNTDPCDVESLVTESRRIFDAALTTYPIPSDSICSSLNRSSAGSSDSFIPTLAARLRLLRQYLDLELGVHPGSGGTKTQVGSEPRAVRLLIYAVTGGDYAVPNVTDALWPSTLVRTSHAYGKCMESIWSLLVALPDDTKLDQFPLTLTNASSCHGLLPPLFLANLIQQLNHFAHQVADIAAEMTVDRIVSGPRITTSAPTLIQANKSGVLDLFLPPSYQLNLYSACLPVALDLFILSLELDRWTSLLACASDCASGGMPATDSTSSQRVRNAFERAVRAGSFVAPMVTEDGALYHIALAANTPSFWSAHLRLVIWRAYMAFGWMSGTSYLGSSTSRSNADPRQRRQALKAVFYRAIEDLPWAKVLYTDLIRYCPEDVEEVVDLLSERELRLRTPLEEVDLLLTAKPVGE
ncbi:unnamed protein product [Dicrocoelium dendriticum]|nr:unnamed protein product [Dicrocoelium dendriticum]